MVRLACVALLVVAGASCKGDLNPAYCAANRSDPDCLVNGVELLDAPVKPECTSSAECSNNNNGQVCDTAAGHCVECIDGVDKTACTGATTVCGTDQQCHGCVTDGSCASGVCLATQACADMSEILYVTPTGTGDCTRSLPCTLGVAVGMLMPPRHIIKLSRVPGTDYTDPPITISVPQPVQIIGKEAVWTPSGTSTAITMTNANLEILGLTIKNAGLDGIQCMAGSLTLQETSLLKSGSIGVEGTACNVTITRSHLSEHPNGAIVLTGGSHEIRNNIIDHNGNSALDGGVVQIAGSAGRLRFNTIVRSISRSGGQRVGGLTCSGGGFLVAQNILADWGSAPNSIASSCVTRDNFVNRDITTVKFVDADTNFHLTPQSPSPDILDAATNQVLLDCAEGDGHIDDIDGEARPYPVFCDRGADEYRP